MRTYCHAIVAVFFLAMPCFGLDPANPAAKSDPTAASSQASNQIAAPGDKDSSLAEIRRLRKEKEGERACLRLRSYKVARVSPHSDVVEARGYTTCEPSEKFNMSLTYTPPERP